ncbi:MULTISPECIES: Nramp family divalent metal transporter [Clostridium]|uniref:Divalent metal cation transporter MntH n=1 Tax=Clostridium beijerinckii TaxID=1520 RepID=A0A1S9ND13_CLOBE|nr:MULTISPECIES: Nramp family divalent metal transporter [Clostridium]MBN7575929.1 Nramp family divalent metal transporter [Clostridium beijerinckii]MBN7581063.1 Nramp family divalent metal transporter [Clostridium beijerinckii]MBN7585650.1 Nramp family divalent metal transporter [Clostridium beijerinckii]MBO0521442.1 Nramp family divalent metal transporter [Clostridium beijerinckii]MZK50340.1 Mn(2+) uptake NRAMP transporter MntH [Clostridium beijerinckii]
MENERGLRSTDVSVTGFVPFKKDRSARIGKFSQLLKYLGPAFIVSVAYIDPGNFATNISGGSEFGYALIWVILFSNLMAIFLQIMSAKLGIATGHNLPEMCAKVFSKKTNWVFWIVAEIGAMATDLAEFLGGTLGLYLLFHIPMIYAGFITGIITFFICYMEKYGQKTIEIIISVLVAIICIAYTIELFLAKPDWFQVGIHTIIPSLPNSQALLIAVGMLGATVMPHVIYLHSHLVQHRGTDTSIEGKLRHLKMEKIDVTIAMNIAFIVNAAMVIVSAAVFNKNGLIVDTMEQAHASLQPLLGSLSSGAFGIALLASGLSSSAVGTMAGQTIMKGFVNLSIPINIRRLITMMPALAIIALGINPMNALVLSQVALSFILPFPIIQMLTIARRKDLMGIMANRNWVRILGIIIAAIIISLNMVLLYLTFTGQA